MNAWTWWTWQNWVSKGWSNQRLIWAGHWTLTMHLFSSSSLWWSIALNMAWKVNLLERSPPGLFVTAQEQESDLVLKVWLGVEQGVCDHRWLDRAQEKEEISWRCNAAGEKLHCCSCLSLLKQPFGCDSSITKSSGLKLPPQQTHDSIFSALPQRGNASLAGRGSATLCSSIEIEDFYLVQLISFKLLF